MSRGFINLPEDATRHILFTTHEAAGPGADPSTAFDADDFVIIKNGGEAVKATTNGISVDGQVGGVTGLNVLQVDMSVDTGDAGFWELGSHYAAVLAPDDETVDGVVPFGVLAEWGLELEYSPLNRDRAEPAAGAIPATASPLRKLDQIFKHLRNAQSQSSTLQTVMGDDGTPHHEATIEVEDGVVTRGELGAVS